MKRFGIITVMAAFIAAAAVGQNAASTTAKGEKTVEEAYLTETYEGKVIMEQAQGDTKGSKQDALLFIKEAIDGGRKNDDIQRALTYLALDGTSNTTREGGVGRILNNYPDVRAKSCEYLGLMGTEDAKQSLVKVVYADNEPMVISAAIRALGTIGDNNADQVTDAISYIVTRYDVLNPDNTLAFEALIAIERIADKNNGIKDSAAIKMVMRIAEGNYITPVKTKAKEIMSKLRKFSANTTATSKAK
jgi:hypothetical protein